MNNYDEETLRDCAQELVGSWYFFEVLASRECAEVEVEWQSFQDCRRRAFTLWVRLGRPALETPCCPWEDLERGE